MLDEPIAEAVCIIADTDKWTVQVATSQRKVTDAMKLGQDVLVSNQVSSLLQSILQLHKLHLPADFVSIWSSAISNHITGKWLLFSILIIKITSSDTSFLIY